MWDGSFSPSLRKGRELDQDADDAAAAGAAAHGVHEASDRNRFQDKFTIVRVLRIVPGEVDVYIKFNNYPDKEYLFVFNESEYQYDKATIAELVLQELKA